MTAAQSRRISERYTAMNRTQRRATGSRTAMPSRWFM